MNGKIIFYEDRNFQGCSYECSSDCSELSSHLKKCNSCRVESGMFMVYDRPNYTGHQYFLRRGEYSEYQHMMGFNDCIRSCRMIPQHMGQFRMRIYENENFAGQMHEVMDDCDSIQERYHMPEMQSCNVMDGHWVMYEQPQFRGRQTYLRPGEYRNTKELGMGNDEMKFQSMRRITGDAAF